MAIPGLQVYLFRRTSPDLLKNHMEGPTSFPSLLATWIEAGLAKINYSTHQVQLGASRVHLCHCQYPKDVYKYQGAEIHVLMMDELTHFEEGQYRFLRSRVRMAGLDVETPWRGRFPRALCASNPGGVGHNWVRRTFVDPQPPMQAWRAEESDGGMLRQYVPARLADNPSIDAEEYRSKLAGIGRDELVRAMLEGDWNVQAGGMFDDLWSSSAHVVAPFAIPRGWSVNRSFDWGSARPYSAGWWAESDGTDVTLADGTRRNYPRGTLFRVAELYGWNGKDNEGSREGVVEIARKIKAVEEGEILKRHAVSAGPADSSIFDTQDGHCIADEFAKHGIRWERADKGPGSRRNGWELMRQRFRASLAHPMEEPGLLAFETCRHFIRTVPTLPRSERDPDDVDTGSEDHIGDETRYRCLTPVRFFSYGAIPW